MDEMNLSSPETEEETAPAQENSLDMLAGRLMALLEENAQAEQHRRTALDEREAALNRRESMAQTRSALEAHSLPAALAEGLCFQDASEMEKAVSALEDAFRQAVQQAVEQRLLQDAPKSTPLKPLSEMTDEEYYAVVCCPKE